MSGPFGKFDDSQLTKLIKERLQRLDSIPASLRTAIDKNNEQVFRSILDELGKLEVKDNKIVASAANLARVASVIDKLKTVMLNSDYIDAIKKFATEIKIQSQLNNSILDKTVGSFKDSELYTATVKASQKNALLLLDENAVASAVLQPIADLLTTSITTSTDYLQAVETLRSNLTGENALFAKYSGQIVKDAFSISDAQYVQLTARNHGIVFYRYDGGEVEDSRQFCVERHGKIFHENEIADWGAFEKTDPSFERPSLLYTTKGGVKVYWEGMNYDTNAATIFSYRGGYNCNHILLPIATEYVPRVDIDRAIELGYYEEVA